MLIDDVQAATIEIGQSIGSWRRLLGLKAEQVAQRAGISLATYSKIENGRGGVSLAKVLAVLRALGLLEKLSDALDPYNSDLGRARADLALPKRVRS